MSRTLASLFCHRQKERTNEELRLYVENMRAPDKAERKRRVSKQFHQTGEIYE